MAVSVFNSERVDATFSSPLLAVLEQREEKEATTTLLFNNNNNNNKNDDDSSCVATTTTTTTTTAGGGEGNTQTTTTSKNKKKQQQQPMYRVPSQHLMVLLEQRKQQQQQDDEEEEEDEEEEDDEEEVEARRGSSPSTSLLSLASSADDDDDDDDDATESGSDDDDDDDDDSDDDEVSVVVQGSPRVGNEAVSEVPREPGAVWYMDCSGSRFEAGRLRAWYQLCLESFPNPAELDGLDSFMAVLSTETAHVRPHLYLAMRGESEVLGGVYVEYYEDCKSAILGYIVVSSNTRGLGLGKKLFDETVTSLEKAHPEILALFAETHGMSFEDGMFPSAARQKYFSDLGFLQVDTTFITPFLYGQDECCYDYCLIARPMVGANLSTGSVVTAISQSLTRSFVTAYWDFVSGWLFRSVEDSAQFQWMCTHGLGHTLYDGVQTPFLTSSEVPAGYLRMYRTPWDMKHYEETLDRFVPEDGDDFDDDGDSELDVAPCC